MTPAARVAAAIEILDDVLSGQSAEAALKTWGRSNRYAGSKDRAAVRDHVFQAIRRRASFAWLGGADTGRGLMLGAARFTGDVDAWFSGQGYAPPPPDVSEIGRDLADAPRSVRLDMPDWMLPYFEDALDEGADHAMAALQDRAGVFLRVNRLASDVDAVIASLQGDGIGAVPVTEVDGALHVTSNERRIAQSSAYVSGLVEVQDPSSQRAINMLSIDAKSKWLDYCAGGGGKGLALAARGASVVAYDIDARRMVDVPSRAARAGVTIPTLATDELARNAPFDGVFCDAPCSGCGTWRRTPEAKWALTPERLMTLTQMQDDVLTNAAPLVARGGQLIYATCSVFTIENDARVAAFLDRSPEFTKVSHQHIAPHSGGDGFFVAVLKRH
ncbi:RsmB/NOP family class I SAM-dependent RNA methyltransferase [Pseudooctadecabacter jejudonensis]|uniref:Ribosomal RNA small subunit methyltransferase B n=1 Tax=Pseudooctadecabacter jejudonensis TaxID=1391910 RepID=A0A1Y5RF62_9RHOB|nr:RsmB/NOP family class I SAM-dependent RNA methyltransferase [Pseudooctadecabacter jejudonensis]SLN14798.1 Ribosomal RNA small subunit methyltransferase B [Pseudooctadecabacter jejudonensis]